MLNVYLFLGAVIICYWSNYVSDSAPFRLLNGFLLAFDGFLLGYELCLVLHK